jgi:hypothetical protein
LLVNLESSEEIVELIVERYWAIDMNIVKHTDFVKTKTAYALGIILDHHVTYANQKIQNFAKILPV